MRRSSRPPSEWLGRGGVLLRPLRPSRWPLWPDYDPTVRPHVDEESRAALEEAVESLVLLRGGVPGEAGATLAAVASLIAGTVTRLRGAVADARDSRYSWAEIATRLAFTAPTARRYGETAGTRHFGLED